MFKNYLYVKSIINKRCKMYGAKIIYLCRLAQHIQLQYRSIMSRGTIEISGIHQLEIVGR
jgi:hypothetical protein